MEPKVRYDLVRRIGVGGMAEVWKAVPAVAGGGAPVAIKKIHNHLTFNRDVRARFADEARIVAGLDHPNVVRVLDFGENEDGDCYIALEYVAGRNLASVIRRAAESRIKIGPSIALHVGIQAARGLAHAHAHGIVHRDVSPQNLLVGWNGEVKIADFGIARVAGMETRTQVGVIRGNAAYLSPEQASQEPLDARTDLFSLGAVMYELLLGKRLNDGANVHLLVNQAANYRFPVSEIAPLSPALQGVMTVALNRDRARRYQDAAEMEEALASVAATIPVEGRRALASLMEALFGAERSGEVAPDPAALKSVTFTTGIVRRAAAAAPPPESPTALGPAAGAAGATARAGDATARGPAAPPDDRTERVRVSASEMPAPPVRPESTEIRDRLADRRSVTERDDRGAVAPRAPERRSSTMVEEHRASAGTLAATEPESSADVRPIPAAVRFAAPVPRRAAWLPALMIAAVLIGAMTIVTAMPPPSAPATVTPVRAAGPRAAWTYQISKATPAASPSPSPKGTARR